jgi:DNA-binding GntR family transcriptional regulator
MLPGTMSTIKGRTRAESAYRSLRDDICAGRLVPGQRLNLSELAKTLGVSLTVVREAAVRLASERFLQAHPQHGFSVWPLSIPHLLDLTRVRVTIESLAIRESAERGDIAWEADLVAAHHRLVNTPPVAKPGPQPGPSSADTIKPATRLPSPAWMKAHSDFHAALAAACDSPLLKELRQQLFDSAELYRHWSVLSLLGKKRGPGAKEHSEMLAAALAHDVDLLISRAEAHIKRTAEALLAGREDELTPNPVTLGTSVHS